MPATSVSFDRCNCEEAFQKDSWLFCSACSPPTTELFTRTAFLQLLRIFDQLCLIFAVTENFWLAVLNFMEFFAHYPQKQEMKSKEFINCALQVTRPRNKQIKRLVQSHIVKHFHHHLPRFLTFRISVTATCLHTTILGCSLINVNWHIWQAQILLLCSSSPKMVQKCCDKTPAVTNVFLCRRYPRSQWLIQKTISQWIISDDVF